jgi:2'-5' RNA ligase
MKCKRIFAAIDIPDEAKMLVTAYITALRRDFGELRVGWERLVKLHITVNFAGYLDDEELTVFLATAAESARTTGPFSLTISGTGAFISRRGSNVLWLGLDAEPFAALAERFRPRAENENERPKRSFNPHLTIARLREPQNSRGLIDRHLASTFEPVEFRADELVVYESELRPTGSVYQVIARYPFGGQPE